ncbi:hypothetical protein BHE74_00037813, partial [Ensete ventricosum]
MGGTYRFARLPVRGPLATGRFTILTCTARYEKYISVRQVTGTRTARYWAVPSKIGRRRSIEEEKGGKKRKRKKEEEGNKEYLTRALSSPACRRRPRVARGRGRFFSCMRRQSVSPREETDRGDKKREKKNLESGVALRLHGPLPAGDFFSPHGEKERGD